MTTEQKKCKFKLPLVARHHSELLRRTMMVSVAGFAFLRFRVAERVATQHIQRIADVSNCS